MANAPVQERSRQTLAAIVAATERLLDDHPFDDISIAEIVRTAGCTTGSFYARFASKEALLPYLYEKYDADLLARYETVKARHDDASLSLEQTLRFIVAETVASYAARPNLMREILIYARRRPEEIGPDIRERRRGFHDDIVERIARHPQITHPDPRRAAAFAFFAMSAAARELILFSHTPFAQSTPLQRTQLEDELVRLALGYLVVPGP